jgi:hypothetical protein
MNDGEVIVLFSILVWALGFLMGIWATSRPRGT